MGAARIVLQDWNNGGISYYCVPPEDKAKKSVHVTAAIVSSFAEEFDIDALLEEGDEEVSDDGKLEMEVEEEETDPSTPYIKNPIRPDDEFNPQTNQQRKKSLKKQRKKEKKERQNAFVQ